jgi:hypothetical protein
MYIIVGHPSKGGRAMRIRVVVALACVGSMAAAQDPESETLRVEREWTGGVTSITSAEYHRITESEGWSKLWERHTGKRDRPPSVDFEKHMVVACFLGAVAYDRVALYAVKKTKEEILFGLTVEEEDCCDFSTHPQYYMAVIPRSTKKLTIIARVKQDLDVDPRKDQLLKEIEELKD